MVTKAADLRANPRAIDPDVKIPAAVRRAAEAADAAQKAAYPDQVAAPAPTPGPTNPDTITIADPPPQPPPAPVTPQGNEPAPQPQPQPTPAPQPQPEPQPAPQQWAPEVELEFHRIRSAEGRKRAQIESQLIQANDRLALLENSLAELQAARNVAPASTPAPPTKLITDQEANEFGPEMIDVMGRRAVEAVSPQLAELRAMMEGLSQEVKGTVQVTKTTAKQTMLASLDAQFPEWRRINKDDGFKAWLLLQDPLFGVTRQSALLKAYEQNDTGRVLNFFKGFVSELAASTPADDPAPVPTPAPSPARPSLDSLAAPGRARVSAQPNGAPAEKQIITTADVNAFYDAVRKGFYNGREAEKQALEQELFAAQREGRVRAV